MKLAAVLLGVSIAASSGCATQTPSISLPECPSPATPVLPVLDAGEPLDSPANLARLMERDDRMRTYIDGLLAALACHQGRRQKHGSE